MRKSESVKEREWQGLHNKTVCNHQLIVVNANIVRSAIAVAHAVVFIFGNYFCFVSISWFMPNFRLNVQRKLRTFLFFRSSFMFWMSLCTYGNQEIAAIKRVLRKNGEKNYILSWRRWILSSGNRTVYITCSQNMEENIVHLIESIAIFNSSNLNLGPSFSNYFIQIRTLNSENIFWSEVVDTNVA